MVVKNNSKNRFTFGKRPVSPQRREGGVIYAEDRDDEEEQHQRDHSTSEIHHASLITTSFDHHNNNHQDSFAHDRSHDDPSSQVHHHRFLYPQIRKSILKVKTLEDSLRFCDNCCYRQMRRKLQNIRRKKKVEQGEQPPPQHSEQEQLYQEHERQEFQEQHEHINNDGDRRQAHVETMHTPSSADDSLHDDELPIQHPPSDHPRVSFSTIQIRSYHIVLIDNPRVSGGSSIIGLSWSFDEQPPLDLEQYELLERDERRTDSGPSQQPPVDKLCLSLPERQRLLQDLGVPTQEVKTCVKRMQSARNQKARAMVQAKRQEQHPQRHSISSSRRKFTKPEWNLVRLDLSQRRQRRLSRGGVVVPQHPERAPPSPSVSSSTTPMSSFTSSQSSLPSEQSARFFILRTPSVHKTDDDDDLQDELCKRAKRWNERRSPWWRGLLPSSWKQRSL
jgi:hypothetical protein